jgi:DNA-binding CsgD family transcriptional regulator/tetratricopeptide (TPR) repeat protein
MTFDEPLLEEHLVAEGGRPQVFNAVYELLRRSLRPTVMVVEDVHWADESTLDLIRFLGRRVDQTNSLLILTYREDAVNVDHPVRVVLVDLAPDAVEVMSLDPLTKSTVSQMAGDGWDADELWRLTGGNPFFVTQLVSTGPTSVPVSIRDAVTARVLRLSDAGRGLVELVSVAPGRLGLTVVEEILGDPWEAIEECERVGILEVHENTLAFRHELARSVIEAELSTVRRRDLNRDVLRVSESRGGDIAVCAHHARETGDADAILRLVPEAARRAAELESHREALSHLRALEPFLSELEVPQLADHYELWAREEYLGGGPDAETLIDKAVELRRQLGERASLGRTLLVASETYWLSGKWQSAVDTAEEAIAALEPVGGEELAMAYSTRSRWSMVASDFDGTVRFADRALAEIEPGPSPARAHALINRGTFVACTNYPHGLDDLEEGYQVAEQLGLTAEQVRAAHNFGYAALLVRDLREARRWQQTARGLLEAVDTPGLDYFQAEIGAWINLLEGDWEEAQETSRIAMARAHSDFGLSFGSFLARILARRGRPEANNIALEAWRGSTRSRQPQYLALAGPAIAELVWLGDSGDGLPTREVTSLYNRHVNPHTMGLLGELAFWLSAIGEIEQVPETALEPFVLLDRGEWRKAAAFWDQRGIPYEKAVCLSFGDTEAKLEALTILDRLEAKPLATRVRRELQSEGVVSVPRGPSRATRESPLGLTQRETEVLELVADRLTNAEIADRLFISARTVDHHVAAILSKLDAETRVDAVVVARRAGVII